jgi:hypothetical protein
MSSLAIDHFLIASAFDIIPLNSNSKISLKNNNSNNEKEQNTATLNEQSVDNEKFENQTNQKLKFRVTGVRFIILFSG